MGVLKSVYLNWPDNNVDTVQIIVVFSMLDKEGDHKV